MRTTTAERLREILSRRNLRQVDVLNLARPYCIKYGMKLSKSDLSQYVTGKVLPGQEKLTILGLALNVSEAWLMGYDVPMERAPVPISNETYIPPGFQSFPELSSVPLVGQIACGDPILAEENIEETVSLPSVWKADFALLCKGDSMAPTVLNGDLVAVKIQPEVENGEIAAVRIGNEATLKRVYLHTEYIELRPENPSYESIIRHRGEMNDVHIEGKVVGFCRGL